MRIDWTAADMLCGALVVAELAGHHLSRTVLELAAELSEDDDSDDCNAALSTLSDPRPVTPSTNRRQSRFLSQTSLAWQNASQLPSDDDDDDNDADARDNNVVTSHRPRTLGQLSLLTSAGLDEDDDDE